MTKTNRFTLIATILLGILLFTILRFADDLNVAWNGKILEPRPASGDASESQPPQIRDNADLRKLLTTVAGIDSAAVLDGYTVWSQNRGFTGTSRLFGTKKPTAPEAFAAMEDSELEVRSASGDARASQTLAARTVFTDPLNALALFHRAAEQGSTNALLRIAFVLEALDAAGSENESADSALGYAIAAVRDGGSPVVDHALLAWLDRLAAAASRDELANACEWSERTLLEIAGRRARWGAPPITTAPPPVFFAVPDLAGRLPCKRTGHPIENLLDLADCAVTPVRNAEDEELDLYICTGS